jgi:hypothetical protein
MKPKEVAKYFYYVHIYIHGKSHSSTVEISTAYGLDNRAVGVRILVGKRLFTSPYRECQWAGQQRSWNSSSGRDLYLYLLLNAYGGALPGGKAAGA